MTTWTSTDIAALESAIARGVKIVQYQSGSVTYHTVTEMLTLLDRMRSEVNAGSRGSQLIFAGRIG